MRVDWSASALADLDRFAAFLSDRHPALAGLVATAIQDRVRILSDYPLLGHPLRRGTPYRELTLPVLHARYVVRYAYDGQRLVILRVFHAREARR